MSASRPRVAIRPVRPVDEGDFIDAVRRSRRLHHPWTAPPATSAAFRIHLERSRRDTQQCFLARLRGSGELVGVVNVSEIVRGPFRSAYLGYCSFTPHARRGYMTEAMTLVLTRAFGPMKLHRLEANIQPGNRASIALVRRLGFRKEGFSPRYLKVGGRWRDHQRWAILAEEWTGDAMSRKHSPVSRPRG